MHWDSLVHKLLRGLGFSTTDPDAKRRNAERMAEILSRPMVIDSVKGLGALHRDPSYPAYLCSQPVKVNVLDGELLPFTLEVEEEDVDLAALRGPIEAAVENFLGLSPDSREELTGLVYANYQEVLNDCDLPPLPMGSKSDIWKYVYPKAVSVKQHWEEEDIYVIVTGNCEWEPEHGLQLVFRNGDKISSVSAVDPSW